MSAAQSMTKKFAIPTMLVVCGFLGSHNASGGDQSGMRVIDEVTGDVMWKQSNGPPGQIPFGQLAISETRIIEDLSAFRSNVYMVAMSPNGQFMVSAGADLSPGKIHNETFVDGASMYDHCHWTLWDIQTGSSLKVRPSTLRGNFTLAFSQCGIYFATGQIDGRVIMYNANDGVEFKTMDLGDQGIEGHTSEILSFSCVVLMGWETHCSCKAASAPFSMRCRNMELRAHRRRRRHRSRTTSCENCPKHHHI